MSKYNNIPTMIDGWQFQSKKEAARYQELKLLQRAGKITNIILQPEYPIQLNGVFICSYYGDFLYYDNEKGQNILEDVKGGSATKTPVYRLKKKLVAAQYGITIVEV